MSGLALMELQKGLFSKLNGDGVLMGMVAGIYDAVPQMAALPYIIIGDGRSSAVAADGVSVTECRLDLQIYTDVGGRKTALNIMNRIHALLHLGALTLTGYQLVLLRVEQAATELAEQARRVHGTMQLVVTVAE